MTNDGKKLTRRDFLKLLWRGAISSVFKDADTR